MLPAAPEALPIPLDWQALIPYMGRANRALAHYAGMLVGLRNQAVLLSPMTTQEAVLSSRIEGTQATLGEVLQFDAGRAADEPQLQLDFFEIVNYRRALREAEQELSGRPFTLNLLRRLHATLLDSVRGTNQGRGEFRKIQNWIGREGCVLDEAEFVPPTPETLMPHLSAWENYYHADAPDALVQLALVHGQFEVIHPFLDGNGRLGRMLIPLFLFEHGLLARPTFYLSGYLEGHRDEYIGCLRAIGQRADGWQRWCEFFLVALAEQAAVNARTVTRIHELYENLKPRVVAATHSQFAVMLLDAIFEHPIFSSTQLTGTANMPSRPMINILLNQLIEAQVVSVLRPSSGRRPQMLMCDELMDICEQR